MYVHNLIPYHWDSFLNIGATVHKRAVLFAVVKIFIFKRG